MRENQHPLSVLLQRRPRETTLCELGRILSLMGGNLLSLHQYRTPLCNCSSTPLLLSRAKREELFFEYLHSRKANRTDSLTFWLRSIPFRPESKCGADAISSAEKNFGSHECHHRQEEDNLDTEREVGNESCELSRAQTSTQ